MSIAAVHRRIPDEFRSIRRRSGFLHGGGANIVYNLPLQYSTALKLDVSNLLNNEHRESVGAPEIGRLAYLQLGVHF